MTTHVKTIWKIPLIPGRKVWMLTFMSMRLLFYQSIKYWKKSQADWFHCRCVFWPWRSRVFSASQDNSKYTAKNISRYLGEKNQILTIPYNTLYFEAAEEAGVPDLFLKFRKSIDPDDRNAFFIQEVKRAADNIIYRLQDLQMKM